ncbi:N-acetylmuramoyl-L-alanine amidase [Candidatus Peregrinibacteria bacterium]|nr:N-acetylmuramoyl-L-alanine amidase [Candidatus Peregrinibacteria bacterium]
MEVLIKYNREIDNDDFSQIEDDHDVNGLGRGAKVYFPKKEYIEKSLKQADLEVEAPPLPAPPEVLESTGYYAGPDKKTAAKWNKMGLERFSAVKKPPVVIPKIRVKVPKMKDGKVLKIKGKIQYEFVLRSLNTGKKAPHGKMPRDKVNGVVIHTTEGAHEELYRNQGIHYVLRRDGTIELIRNLDIAIDHAGIMDNSSSKAMWRGDKKPSLHTVGIEVVNPALSNLVKSGEVLIDANPKVVKSKLVGKRTVYYTDQAPTEKALKKGRAMALKARALTEKQNAALKQLVHWLGHEFNLKKRDVWTHSMVATSKFGRGRKADPPILDWSKLGLPDNHWQIDQDVLAGQIIPNLVTIEKYRSGESLEMANIDGKQYYQILQVTINGKTTYTYNPKAHFGAKPTMTSGLKATVQMKESQKKKEDKTTRNER